MVTHITLKSQGLNAHMGNTRNSYLKVENVCGDVCGAHIDEQDGCVRWVKTDAHIVGAAF
jgi:hypothetical protein